MRSLWFPVYRLLAAAAMPLAARRLAAASAVSPSMLARQPERRGHVPSTQGELWVHAASVGELNAAEPLLRKLIDNGEQRIVLTTLTHTAAEESRVRFGSCDAVRHVFAPLDTVACVSRWLDHTRPRALLLVETEIWPVLLDQCRRRSIPVAMVNARISGRAFPRYLRFAGLFGTALSEVNPVLCQSDLDKTRFQALGCATDRTRVTGNLKFDMAGMPPPSGELIAWQQRWSGRPAWVAGSTHAGEESLLAKAQRELLLACPGALLIVVPRHPERGTEALAALRRAGLDAYMIGDWPEIGEVQAVVVDRMGVLGGIYQLADVCVVCGSLVDGIGGHNLLEPAMAGKPILTGRFTADQQTAAEGLGAVGGLLRVGSEDLAERLAEVIASPELAAELAASAGAFARSQRGALERTFKALEPWLALSAGQAAVEQPTR